MTDHLSFDCCKLLYVHICLSLCEFQCLHLCGTDVIIEPISGSQRSPEIDIYVDYISTQHLLCFIAKLGTPLQQLYNCIFVNICCQVAMIFLEKQYRLRNERLCLVGSCLLILNILLCLICYFILFTHFFKLKSDLVSFAQSIHSYYEVIQIAPPNFISFVKEFKKFPFDNG